jgi:uncharacterized protein with GYD domain
MPLYLSKVSYTPETWAKLIKEPEDRRETVGRVLEAVGGKLHGLWFAFGDHDGYVLVEAPDNTAAASALLTVAGSGVHDGAADRGGDPGRAPKGAEHRLPSPWRLNDSAASQHGRCGAWLPDLPAGAAAVN